MGGAISLIIMAVIAYRVIARIQKDASTATKSASVRSYQPQIKKNKLTPVKASGVNRDLQGGTKGSNQVINTRKPSSIAALSAIMEDRGNDWLARQLADERVAKRRMSEMFNLKQEHMDNCDANHNRIMHAANCDAGGIDTARG